MLICIFIKLLIFLQVELFYYNEKLYNVNIKFMNKLAWEID